MEYDCHFICNAVTTAFKWFWILISGRERPKLFHLFVMTLNYTQYLLKAVLVQSHNTENSWFSVYSRLWIIFIYNILLAIFAVDVTNGLFQVTSLLLSHLVFVIAIYLHSRAAMQVFPHGSGKEISNSIICLLSFKSYKTIFIFSCRNGNYLFDLIFGQEILSLLSCQTIGGEDVFLPYTYHNINRIESYFFTVSMNSYYVIHLKENIWSEQNTYILAEKVHSN